MSDVSGVIDIDAATAYAERHTLHALVVAQRGRIAFETYGWGNTGDHPHALFSGTKSFWGVAAVAAQEDGLLGLDEPVYESVPEWRDDPRKSQVMIRDLLQLTSGFGFGGLGNAVPTAEAALAIPLKTDPGTAFTYGGIPLQVFGEVLRRKLAGSPHDYLNQRILAPIGLRVGSWRKLKDGTHPLPTGASVAAHEWLKFGQLVLDQGAYKGSPLVAPAALAQCFVGSTANARYGLGFWLSPLAGAPDVAYASGSGGQAMYVMPSREAIVVHFGASSSWKHETFLRRLLGL